MSTVLSALEIKIYCDTQHESLFSFCNRLKLPSRNLRFFFSPGNLAASYGGVSHVLQIEKHTVYFLGRSCIFSLNTFKL